MDADKIFETIREKGPGKTKAALHLLGNRLLAGILISVPLIVTILVLRVAYNAIHGVTAPFLSAFGINFPGSGFFATLLLLLLVGFMATNVLGKKVIASCEAFLLRIPLISPVYSAVKQALDSFKSIKENRKFRSVAYIEYPSKGCHLIGFVTGNLIDPIQKRPMTTVFLPTSPNPMTGFVVAVPDELLVESGLTLEQASKIIVSAGLVSPARPEEGAPETVLASDSGTENPKLSTLPGVPRFPSPPSPSQDPGGEKRQ